jgi:ArsR family transcriptional regulator
MRVANAAAAFAALGHTLRMEVWRMLLEQGPLGLPAGTIATRLAVAPSSLSFHLQQMTQSGVLLQHRNSRQMIYVVNNDIIGALCDLLIGGGMIPIIPPALASNESGDILGQR